MAALTTPEKKRIVSVLKWIAFANVLLVVFTFSGDYLDAKAAVDRARNFTSIYDSDQLLYMREGAGAVLDRNFAPLRHNDWLIVSIFLSPILWIFLYVWTGSAGFVPWRKPLENIADADWQEAEEENRQREKEELRLRQEAEKEHRQREG